MVIICPMTLGEAPDAGALLPGGAPQARLDQLERDNAALRAEIALLRGTHPAVTQALPDHLDEPPGVGTWRFEPGRRRWWWSRGVYALLGCDPAAGPPDTDALAALVAPADLPRLSAIIEDVLAERRLITRFDFRLAGGPPTRHISVTVHARWLDPDGEVVLSGVLFDVTAEKGREASVAAALARLESLDRVNAVLHRDADIHDVIDDAVACIRRLFAADRAAMFRHSADDPRALTMLATDEIVPSPERLGRGVRVPLPPPADIGAMPFNVPLTYGGGAEPLPPEVAAIGLAGLAVVRLRGNGLTSWLLALHFVHEARRWPEADLELLVDVGHRIEDKLTTVTALEALAASQQRLESILGAVPESIFRVDRDGRVLAVYASERGDLDRMRDDVQGRRLGELLADHADAILAAIHRALETNAVVTLPELRVSRGEGQRVSSARVAPLGDPARGEALWVARDVTAEWRLQEQLRHTQKLESLGMLAGGIAHDFNNFLAAVLGNVALLRDEAGPAPSPLLGEIERAARRGAELCAQLLAYSGKGRFTVEPVDLNALVDDMATILHVSLSKKARVHLDLGAGLPRVDADRTQVAQVVMNLLINASEALADRAGDIHVATRAVALPADADALPPLVRPLPPGRYALLEVRDSGRGMDAETAGRIFEPFFSTKFPGRGLGLPAVLGIVGGHGGSMGVETAPGAGSRFAVAFPATVRRPTPVPRSGRSERPAKPGRGRLLVVDDDDAVRLFCERALSRAGYSVATASDGVQAVERFTAEPDTFDAVVLDLTMPELSGAEVLQRIVSVRADVPVLLISGYNEHEAIAHVRGGLAGFLAKPFDTTELLTTLNAILAGPDS